MDLKHDVFTDAKAIHKQVQKVLHSPSDLYLVLQCYARLKPSVIDAAFISSRGGFESKSASFIGTAFFGFDSPKGYSITNLGKIENSRIDEAFFIPPASPAMKKTQGVLTVNGEMFICTSERQLCENQEFSMLTKYENLSIL